MKIKKIINRIQWLPIFLGTVMVFASRAFDGSFTPFFRGVPLTEITRWLMTLAGIFFIFYGLISKDASKELQEATICPKCQTPFGVGLGLGLGVKKDSHHEFCPRCKVKLEPLNGFYKRHPELKEAEIDTSREERKNN